MQNEQQNQTILVVDDAKENIVILSHLLKSKAEIIFSTNGEDGLAKAQAQIPDLILLDISMPGMNGFDVLRKLQKNSKTDEIPVIFVTGIPDSYNEEKGLRLGAVDYITKPFSPEVVSARVDIQLKLRHLTRNLQIANEELTEMAMTDSLTGAFNRRHFMQAAQSELKRLHRHEHPACTIMLDIDNFKNINDQFGHDMGDRVLLQTSNLCKSLLRVNGIFGRLGGEEFAVLLPETELEEASLIATRLCHLLAETVIEIDARIIAFSASFGVSHLWASDKSCEEALKRADQALYKAKRDGRNRVVIFDQEITNNFGQSVNNKILIN